VRPGIEANQGVVTHALLSPSKTRNMTELTSPEQIEQMFQLPIAVVFKHSYRCPVSRVARSEVERFAEELPEVPVFLVDVIRNSSLSKSLAEKTGVKHESPQTMVLHGGVVSWHASHYRVTKSALRDNLAT
jgi:bacillithiol system protein YtxJ